MVYKTLKDKALMQRLPGATMDKTSGSRTPKTHRQVSSHHVKLDILNKSARKPRNSRMQVTFTPGESAYLKGQASRGNDVLIVICQELPGRVKLFALLTSEIEQFLGREISPGLSLSIRSPRRSKMRLVDRGRELLVAETDLPKYFERSSRKAQSVDIHTQLSDIQRQLTELNEKLASK